MALRSEPDRQLQRQFLVELNNGLLLARRSQIVANVDHSTAVFFHGPRIHAMLDYPWEANKAHL